MCWHGPNFCMYLCQHPFKNTQNKEGFVSFHALTCMTDGESAISGVAGGSSLMSLRPPTSDLMLPIRSRACSLRFSLFSIRAKACRMASIFLSSRVCRVKCGVGRRDNGEEEGAEALVHGVLISHRAPEIAIQRVNVCYTAKADLAQCRVPSAETSENVTPHFRNKKGQKVRGDRQEKMLSGCVKR